MEKSGPSQPTVLSSDKTEKIGELKVKLEKLKLDKPFIGPDGYARYATGELMPGQIMQEV